ncbi:MAG: ribonuclease III [bacterium]|jgi:ribonuclease-3|nr:ribonuclease III [bacterium]
MKLLSWLTRGRPVQGASGLETAIGYTFRQPELLHLALTHRSHSGQQTGPRVASNERLEFLGDAVLDLCVSHHLFLKYPEKKEGELTKLKSIIVSGPFLVRLAGEIGLGRHLLLSESEDRTGGRQRPSILEDAFEALLGAIYLDGGLPAAEDFIRRQVLEGLDLTQASRDNRNYKSLLLELSQSHGGGNPVYKVVEEVGPDHSKFFVVEVLVDDQPLGRGTGASKKKAEQAAAREGLEQFSHRRTEGGAPVEAHGPA